MKCKIIIDPIANVYYSGFYIKGLYGKFGIRNIKFNSKPFENIKDRSDNFNFIIINENITTKYSIHYDDPFEVKPYHYEWCDVYGCVNANFEKTPVEFHSKLVSLPPSFGIQLWGTFPTLFYLTINALKVWKITNIRKLSGKYKRQLLLRLPYKDYLAHGKLTNVLQPYIFHLSTLWYSDEWNKNDEGVNKVRANFISACKSIDSICFEGGLSVSKKSVIQSDFKPFTFEGTISIKEYVNKIEQSVLVFNTPAFWNCHGWKLGEYLAMGKAIISTPLSNDLPEPLIHGENIHFVANDELEIKNAILLIINDEAYRIKLENGARTYWEKYGTPIKSLELLGV
jgi:glycosyltransferase involved in cell wall biosynthesis